MTSHTADPAEYMDTREVAAYLRLKERKIYDLVKEKRIPCVRVTGKWLFSRTSIETWLRSNADNSTIHRPRPHFVATGSHDPLLEWCIRRLDGQLPVVSSTSCDGLARMADGQAVLAGVHLFDAESGEYNIPAVRATMSERNVALIEWGWREQGLIVPAGNPLGLKSLGDLVGRSARVALRQEGSGAGMLFKWLLQRAEIRREDLVLAGEALNETEIGLSVLDGSADAGLAVASVAHSLRLDFVPLHRERFDLVVDRQAYFEPALQRLFKLAMSDEGRAKAASLGGYDLGGMGTVLWNAP